MNITAIKTSNFLGARNVDIKIDRPITLVCGYNHSGKSSLAEAVRMALTGESVRVSLKKDYVRLITAGQSVGYAEVWHDAGRSTITLPKGAHEHTGPARTPAVLPYVLDAPLFARLDVNERRQFLFGLMGLQTDGPAVAGRLAAKGCDPDKSDEILPYLRAGFEDAHKEAQSRARDAKSAWRTVTGETYGSVKAAAWEAKRPEFSAERLRLNREESARLAQQIEEGSRAVGEMQGRAKAHADHSAKTAGLRERAMQFARISAKLRKDEEELNEWQAKVEHEARKVGKQLPAEPTYSCPSCGAVLRHDHANGALVEFTSPPIVGTADPVKLTEYERARDLLERSVKNDKRDLADADAAARTLAEIGDADAYQAPSREEIESAKIKVDDIKKWQDALQGTIKALEQDERALAQADSKTAAARGHHADVAQWEAIADALAPSGIQGEMLAEALEPINERLARSAADAEWLRVRIEPDMTITGDGRPYALLSESERWRSDATIAEAISHISGVKLMVLDRVDVLDLAGRDDLLYWLDGLVVSGEIETALLFATLKTLPDGLQETIGAIWIEHGTAKNTQDAS